jgi:CHAT domain-containing protein/tetratricopeptide (TPR) repeat protein
MKPLDPHLKAALDQLRLQPTQEAWEQLNAQGVSFHGRGQLDAALHIFIVGWMLAEHMHGSDHPHTLTSINSLGATLEAQGRLTDAELYLRAAVQTCRRLLAEDHPDTLSSINKIGLLLQAQGKLAEAEPYLREALEKRRSVLGEEHPDTLRSINNMGSLLNAQGRLSEAEPHLREAMEKSRRVLGEEHPDTLSFINNLAVQLLAQGKLAEAEPYLREALEKRRSVLGEEHRDTLRSINNMGSLLNAQGRLSEAEPYLREAMEKSRRVLGEEHPDTLGFINVTGLLLQAQGKLAKAEPYLREALEKRRWLLGQDHPHTLHSFNSMGLLLKAQGKLAQAERCFRDALEKSRSVLGDEHPDTLTSINNMGLLLEAQGKLAEAEPFYGEALERARRVLGEEHPNTLSFINNLAVQLLAQGKLAEAEPYLREALEKRRSVLGEEHPDTLRSINNMGFLLDAEGKHTEAERYLRDAVEKHRCVLGREHPDTLTSISNLGGLLHDQGKLDEAENLFAESLRARDVLRSSAVGVVDRATLARAMHIPILAAVLATLRARQGGAASSVLDAIESGSSRSILDLLQSNAMDKLAAAAERVREGRWTSERAAHYEADLDRSAELEFLDKQLLDQGMLLSDTSRAAIASELSEVGKRLSEAEKELLPSAQPRELAEIRSKLRSGEVLLVYGWSTIGISLVAVPHTGLDEEPSAHWVSRVHDAPTPPETAKREQALIDTMQSVAVLIAAGLAPEPARAKEVAKALVAIEADVGLTSRLGTTSMQDAKRLVVSLQNASDAMAKDPTQKRGVPSMPTGSLGALSRVLLDFALPEAIRPLLGRATRVIVVPSGPLHELPLEVLVGLANFAELKDKPVTVVPSGSILALIRSRGGDVRRDGIAAVGDPDADLPGTNRGTDGMMVSELESLLGERAEGQGRLPRARTEATLVAEYRGEKPLIDTDATTSRLRTEAPGMRVVHIAAHAVLGAMGDPLASAILLSSEPAADGQVDSGRLSVGDLIATWGDRLKGCELAVLSCCQTGRGVQVGDSLMALPIGLLHAGVNAIVASLWKVDDLATCLLMARFHQNLLGDHRTLGEEIDEHGRIAWGKPFRRAEPMPVPQALAEARAWLSELPAKALNDFAKRYPLPIGADEDATDIQIAQARAAETKTPPFAAPAYWAAFVVIGDGNF